jgi:O-antigen/teichoic acid export membrane protein
MLDQPQNRPKAPGNFDTGHIKKNLGEKSARAGAIIVVAQAVKFILNLASLSILARLLVPGDFGLVAMVTPLYRLAGFFQDLGLSAATIQKREITPAQVSNLFWLNVTLSVILGILMAALSPWVAAFYGRPELAWITTAFGAMMISSGLSAQHIALLQRQMRNAAISSIEVVSMALGIAAAITGAVFGLGYWSLVLTPAVTTLSTMVLVWITSGFRPGLPSRGSGVASMIAFGYHLMLSYFCQFLNKNADNVMVGKAWGDTALGFYTRAYNILLLPMSQLNIPINKVAIPALSRLQDDPDRYRSYYYRAIGILLSFGFPIVCYTAVDAHNVVLLVLGSQWGEAVDIFRALVPAAFVGATNAATGWVYVSLGNTRRMLKWSVLQTVLTIIAFALGLSFGPIGVAIAFSTVSVVLRIPSILYCFEGTPLTLTGLLWALMPAATAAIAAALAFAAIRYAVDFGDLKRLWLVMLDLAIYGTLYLAIYVAIPQGFQNAKVIFGTAFRMLAGFFRKGTEA